MTLEEFQDRYPEFESASDTDLPQACLDAAAAELSETELGTSYSEAHGLLAAHKLAMSPYGANARVQLEGGMVTSTYIHEFREVLRRRIFPGFAS